MSTRLRRIAWSASALAAAVVLLGASQAPQTGSRAWDYPQTRKMDHAPTGMTIAGNTGGVVRFSWTAPAGAANNGPTTYVLEAGANPGTANLAIVDLGGTATNFSTGGVGAGTYYVRVKARNKCGTSAASNEVALIVP